MADNPFMNRAPSTPDGKPKRHESNSEILAAYLVHVKAVHSTSMHLRVSCEVRKFLEYWKDTLILDVTRADLRAYADVYVKSCTHFRRGGFAPRGHKEMPNWCRKGLPLDCASCPSYEGMKAVTTEHHLNLISGLFRWLLDKDQIQHNEWEVVARRWREQNQRRIKKEISARRLNKRFLAQTEMVQLIERAPSWTWRIVALMGAKYFLRAGELARLKVTPKYLDPELDWIVIPMAAGNDGKRIVEVPYPIDAETRSYLRAYLRWRKAKLWRCGKHPDAHEQLIINQTGKPFVDDDKIGTRLTNGLRREAKTAGLQDPGTVKSHCLRYFASDRAQANGIHGNELKLLRGDWLESDATGAYIDTKRLREVYAKGCPPLGLRSPI